MVFPTSVLVTGVTGCVGSTLARRLVGSGIATHGLVRKQSNASAHARYVRSAYLSQVQLAECLSGSVEELTAILDRTQPQVIVHLASAGASPRDRNVTSLLKANVELTANLLQAAEASCRPYIVHVGSCFEYADAGQEDLDEQSTIHPYSLYGATKSASVNLAIGLAIELQLRLVVMRLFGVYGPSESPDRFIPTVIRHLACGQAMVMTPGTQRRDLMMVEDTASALMVAMQSFEKLDNLGIYNVCTGVETSIRQVGDMIAEEMNSPASLLEWGALPARHGEPERIVGDGTRFREATLWQPLYDLRSGLRHTIQALAPQLSAQRRAA